MSEPRYYSIKLTPKANRDIRKISKEYQKALCEELISLAGERNPKRWMHRIIGQRGLYSVRAGDYRAVVVVKDDVMIILVIEAGHRSTIYRKYES